MVVRWFCVRVEALPLLGAERWRAEAVGCLLLFCVRVGAFSVVMMWRGLGLGLLLLTADSMMPSTRTKDRLMPPKSRKRPLAFIERVASFGLLGLFGFGWR